MKRFGLLVVAGAIALSMMACQRDQEPVMEKLEEIDSRIANLEDAVGSGSAGSGEAADAKGKGDQGRERKRPQRPDPNTVYSVPLGDSPQVGPDDAKVTIVEAFEFACGYCHKVHPTIKELIGEYGDDIRVVWKNFVVHPDQATTPALAACAADEQDKYVEMTDQIWKKGFENRDLGEENMKKIARDVGLDMNQFEADMKGDDCQQQLDEDMKLLRRVGTRGTPNFYINGRPLAGAQPIDKFRAVIDQELEKAEERIGGDTPAEDYYAKYVVEEGERSL